MEVVLKWHASAYLFALLGCFGTLQMDTSMGHSHDADIEPNGDDALNVHDDAHVIAYLQMREILCGLTPKKCDWV